MRLISGSLCIREIFLFPLGLGHFWLNNKSETTFKYDKLCLLDFGEEEGLVGLAVSLRVVVRVLRGQGGVVRYLESSL